MKKKLYYLLLLAVLASACNSKENSEEPTDPDDPKGYKEKIQGDWMQYKRIQYREGSSFKDTTINNYSPPPSPPHYYRFTGEKYYNGLEKGAEVVFNDWGNFYQIKGDSIYLPFHGLMTFAGDSLKIESRTVITGVKTYTVEVIYRYQP